MTDHALKAQQAAEERLEELWNADDGDLDTLGLYCGCTTCVVREVLEAAAPELLLALVEAVENAGVQVAPEVREKFLSK